MTASAEKEKTGKPRRRQREETEARILEEAHALLKEQRLAAFSLRQLAARLDMRLSHLQHYFPHTADLLARLLEQFIEKDSGAFLENFEAASGSGEEKLQRALSKLLADEAYLDSCDLFMSEVAALAHEDDRIAASLARYYAEYEKAVAALVTKLNPALKPKAVKERAAMAVSLIEGALRLRHALGKEINARALARAITRLAEE